ncbi:MAG: DNA translocase FtsK 4TM domain-containing protein [Pseudomonadota bacterium]
MVNRTDRTGWTLSRTSTVFHRLESGLWGLGITGLSALGLLSLVSYRAVPTGPPRNWIGPVGASLADLLLSSLGTGAFMLIGTSLAAGVLLILERFKRIHGRRLIGAALVLLAAAILSHLVIGYQVPWPHGGGGLLGALTAELLVAMLGGIGASLIALLIAVAGGSLLAHRTPQSLLVLTATPAVNVGRWFRAGLGGLWRDYEEWRDSRARARPGRETESRELFEDGDDEHAETLADAHPYSVPPVVTADDPVNDEVDDPDQTRAQRISATARPETSPSIREAGEPGTADAAALLNLPDTGVFRVIPVIEDRLPEGLELDPVDEDDLIDDPSEMQRVYALPSLNLLDKHPPIANTLDRDLLQESARVLMEKLRAFKVGGEVTAIHPGPVISLFEFRPETAVKVASISNLSKDLAMALSAEQVRVVAPIPGKDVVGFEVPNRVREMVYLRDLLAHKAFTEARQRLPLVLGKDIAGKPSVADLTKMPHLLIAGTTGSGKSIAIHSFIMSVLFRYTPDQVRFLLIDPKMLELTAYKNIPHLLHPVVTEPGDAAVALRWAVSEMERRNRLMSEAGVPNIAEYNALLRADKDQPSLRASIRRVRSGPDGERLEETVQREEREHLPYIVVVIDELADLMMVAGKHVETIIARLAQLARASGIHMMIATQNPTIKVVTGIIKANMPTRISFKVRSMQDSRVILDQNGADDLLGYGDMLHLPSGSSKLQRVHGAFVSTEERNRVVEFLRNQGMPRYNDEIMRACIDAKVSNDDEDLGTAATSDAGDIYERAVALAAQYGRISTSKIQQVLEIGYNRAARLMNRMEKEGLVGPPEAAGKPRIFLG